MKMSSKALGVSSNKASEDLADCLERCECEAAAHSEFYSTMLAAGRDDLAESMELSVSSDQPGRDGSEAKGKQENYLTKEQLKALGAQGSEEEKKKKVFDWEQQEQARSSNLGTLVGIQTIADQVPASGAQPGAYDVPGIARQESTSSGSVSECSAQGEEPESLDRGNNQELAVASALDLQEASRVDASTKHQGRSKERTKMMSFGLGGLVLLVGILVAIVVAVVSTRNSGDSLSEEAAPSFIDPSDLMIPMDNLERLFDALPSKTKESLMDPSTPQSKAWEWLLGQQNITHLEEWRKQQLFALTTFFYAFEGPQWNPKYSQNWLNDTLEECSWSNTDLDYMYRMFAEFQQNTDNTTYDFRPCNDAGEMQTLALIFLQLPPTAKPFIPPEVALLPSLSNVILGFNKIKAALSDMIPQEIYQLSTLKVINFHGNAIHGTIPDQIGRMSTLHYVMLGENQITGSIPPSFARMSELRQLSLIRMPLTGTLPTELGMLSKLTDLEVRADLTGTIPTELGLITILRELTLHDQSLTGTIPSQLGLLTDLRLLRLRTNHLTGSIPYELGLLTNALMLELNTNDLTGSIPAELSQLTEVKILDLTSLPMLSGVIPDHLCYLKDPTNSSCSFPFKRNFKCSLDFDCTELLCGCDCPCSVGDGTGFVSGNHTTN